MTMRAPLDGHQYEYSSRQWPALLLSSWFAHKRLVLLVVVGCALASFGFGLLLRTFAPSYTSEAILFLSKPRYQVELESKIRSNQEPLGSAAMNATTSKARGDTLKVVAESREVEAAVQQRLADQLAPEDLRPGRLIRRIRVRPSNELLRLSATAETPELAAALANTWSEEFTRRAETIFSASAGSEAIQSELEKARRAYEAADQALSRFPMEQPLDAVTRRAQAKADEINLLTAQRTGFLKNRLNGIYSSINVVEGLIRDGETFRAQLEAPAQSTAASAGDALALMMLRARSYLNSPVVTSDLANVAAASNAQAPGTRAAGNAQGTTQPGASVPLSSAPVAPVAPAGPVGNLQFSPGELAEGPTASRVADVDALLTALRARRAALLDELSTVRQLFEAGFDPAADPTDASISRAVLEQQQLQAELAELNRQQAELSSQRAVLGTTYNSLVNKAEELRVATATAEGAGIALATQAVPPEDHARPHLIFFALAGALVGLLLAAAIALNPLVDGFLKSFGSAEPPRSVASPEPQEPRPVTA